MRLSATSRALVPVAAISITVAAAAKAPRHRTTAQASAPAPTASSAAPSKDDAPPSDSKGRDTSPPRPDVAPGPSATPPSAPDTSPLDEPRPASSGAMPETAAPEAEPGANTGASNGAAGAASHGPPPPPSAAAATRTARAKALHEEDEAITPARDTVGGPMSIGVDAALLVPFGNVGNAVPQSRTMGPGLSLGGDLGYGISRTVMFGAYVDVGLPSTEAQSSGQSITTIAVGPMIRYHLVQGLAFDPWVSGGLGFRHTSVGSTSLTGVDWCRLAIGGDWYPASNFGFGPFVALSLGTFFSESPGTLGQKALNAHFLLGGRIVFDGPGK